MNIIARDPIDNINTSAQVAGLFNNKQYRLSRLEQEQKAYTKPVYKTEEEELQNKGISSRGLLNSVMTGQGIFALPMIKDNNELIKRFTFPTSGTASNPNLNRNNVMIGEQLVNNSQSAYSGRLY
jgi:hypothetical protein